VRLFLALWPSERVREDLARVGAALAKRAAGKPVPSAKIHLTLAFLGEVADARLDRVRDAANEARAARFELVLDGVGTFRKARVAWAGSSEVPAALARLQADLEEGLRSRGFALDTRPFAAHVTLARKIGLALPRAPMPAIAWRAEAFVLVRSETGTGSYSVMESWPLEAARMPG